MATDNKKNRFYFNKDFLGSPQGRSVRILSEYYGPLQKINNNKIYDTIVFFGSARIKNEIEAEKVLKDTNLRLSGKVVTKISLLKNYCPAEEYHQKYLEKR